MLYKSRSPNMSANHFGQCNKNNCKIYNWRTRTGDYLDPTQQLKMYYYRNTNPYRLFSMKVWRDEANDRWMDTWLNRTRSQDFRPKMSSYAAAINPKLNLNVDKHILCLVWTYLIQAKNSTHKFQSYVEYLHIETQ